MRRVKAGDVIHLSDGAGRVFDARVEGAGPSKVSVTVVSELSVPRPHPKLTIAQGVAKGRKVDLVIEKLVELGVDEIVVFNAERSIPIWDDQKRRNMAERYRGLAYAAAKQSRRAWFPEVRGPVDRSDILSMSARSPRCLIASPSADASFRQAMGDRPHDGLTLIVGPEGGFGPDEVADFAEAGAIPVRLGPQILRTETAPLVLASIALYELGRLE
ncbi:MAG: 16S rRNA (uracil(1498)-N(3))-methyltransferase [Actinomycetota bacterium]|nr:16S rRNA (uracil(1498)-N(3))-methyltransferase [Actinomycetota bacterium]